MTRESRQATQKEIRRHYKTLGNEVRITSYGEIQFRRDRDRFPGSPQVWLLGGLATEYHWDDEHGVILL
jgi:hypothetical protein